MPSARAAETHSLLSAAFARNGGGASGSRWCGGHEHVSLLVRFSAGMATGSETKPDSLGPARPEETAERTAVLSLILTWLNLHRSLPLVSRPLSPPPLPLSFYKPAAGLENRLACLSKSKTRT